MENENLESKSAVFQRKNRIFAPIILYK